MLAGAAVLGLTTASVAQQRVADTSPVSGSLAASDRQLSSGEYFDDFTITGRAGERVELRLDSSEFDPYVQISGPEGFSRYNDDATPGNLNSRLVVTLPADGTYRVMVTSYQPGESGAYRLTMSPAAAGLADSEGGAPTTVAATASTGAQPATTGAPRLDDRRGARDTAQRGGGDTLRIEVGGQATGTLANGDQRLSSGEFFDGYRFEGRRGDRVQIDIRSSQFDTYAIVRTPSGEQIDNDDGPEGLNARIDEVLPEDGVYTLSVTSYRPGETGQYTLSVAEGREPERLAAVPSGQRVFAVMVGVSDYGQNGINDLPFTDDDAVDLTASLRRAGVLNPASVTITNADATIPAVRQAFARVAAAAGPDDLFIFFFSGHGVQVDSAVSAIEPDGRDEVIVLRDGNLSDDELAEMFGTLRTRMQLVILDSCYSGGFARDMVTRPGIMGLFSSEEDLTSLVAEDLRSGGYLAHFLRAALAGEADTNGDRALSAGELVEFLRVGFQTPEIGRLDATTTEGQRNYQNFVFDRGGVQVDDIVMRLGEGAARAARPSSRRRGR